MSNSQYLLAHTLNQLMTKYVVIKALQTIHWRYADVSVLPYNIFPIYWGSFSWRNIVYRPV